MRAIKCLLLSLIFLPILALAQGYPSGGGSSSSSGETFDGGISQLGAHRLFATTAFIDGGLVTKGILVADAGIQYADGTLQQTAAVAGVFDGGALYGLGPVGAGGATFADAGFRNTSAADAGIQRLYVVTSATLPASTTVGGATPFSTVTTANGLSASGANVAMAAAAAGVAGAVTTASQTFDGAKTFTNAAVLSGGASAANVITPSTDTDVAGGAVGSPVTLSTTKDFITTNPADITTSYFKLPATTVAGRTLTVCNNTATGDPTRISTTSQTINGDLNVNYDIPQYGCATFRTSASGAWIAESPPPLNGVSVNPVSVAATTCNIVSVTATGRTTVGDRVVPTPPATLDYGLYVYGLTTTAAGTLRFRLCNVTGGAIDPANATWYFDFLR